MRESQSICARFDYNAHILVVFGAGYGVAQSASVLMTAKSAERILFAVQYKALVRVDGERSEPESLFRNVCDFASVRKLGARRVEVRVCGAVP